MSEKKKKNKKLSKSAMILIIGICIIVIPLTIYGGILISAAMQTGTPIFGDRYKGDLEPAITDEDLSAVETTISSISGVEKVDAVLTSGQLRINVDTNDSLTDEEIEKMVDDVYEKVSSKLSINTYFTSTKDKKMYDLAINVYNKIDAEDESMIYYVLTKNAMMEEPEIQCVSVALDEDLAAELRGENETSETVEPTGSTQNEVE